MQIRSPERGRAVNEHFVDQVGLHDLSAGARLLRRRRMLAA
jgi:hypothetical protein